MIKKSTIIFSALLFIFSCTKDPETGLSPGGSSPQVDGLGVSFKINGQAWKNTHWILSRTTFFNLLTQQYKVIDGASIPYEFFSICQIQRSLVKQTLYPFRVIGNQNTTYATFDTRQSDGDVVCEGFNVLDSDSINNFVIITKEVNNYKEIWGEFSATLIKTETCAIGKYPDTLRIREGKFHLLLP